MFNGITFNPYTGQKLTQEEIKILDAKENGGNGDGKVSLDELTRGADKLNSNNSASQGGALLTKYLDEMETMQREADKANKPSASTPSESSNDMYKLSSEMQNAVIADSPLASKYQATGPDGFTLCKHKSLSSAVEDDLRSLADSIKKQLKAQLGSAYDEAKIQGVIDQAIVLTLMDVKDVSLNYDDDRVMGGFIQGYSVKYVVDDFMIHFNELVDQDGNNTQLFDKSEVIVKSHMVDVYDNDWKAADYMKTIQKLHDSLKASIEKNNPDIPSFAIENILNDAIKDTQDVMIKDIQSHMAFKTKVNLSNAEMGIKYIVDTYLEQVEKRLQEYKATANNSELVQNGNSYYEVTDDMKDSIISDSDVKSRYQAKDVKGLKNCKTSCLFSNIENDLRSLTESLKKQLKEKYGADYNEEKIQALIDKAIALTLMDAKEVSIDADDDRVIGGISALYSVKYIVDNFMTHFNEVAYESTVENKPQEVFDRSMVITQSGNLIGEYDNKWIVTNSKSLIAKVHDSLKASIAKNNPDLTDADIEKILSDAEISTTEFIMNNKQGTLLAKLTKDINKMNLGVKYFIDTYFDQVEAKIKEHKTSI